MAEKSFGVKEINLIGASGTPTIESPNNLNLNAVNVAISTNVSIGGTLTVTGNVSVGGTLTYEDVTNIDSVGIVTAREGIKIPDDKEITFGAGGDGFIKSDGANFLIQGGGGGTGTTYVRGRTLRLSANGGSGGFNGAVTIDKSGDERVQLKYGSSTKLVTTNTGLTVTGTLVATTFSGSGASLTNLPGIESDAQGNTVGGSNAGDSFNGTNAQYNTLIGKDAGTAITNGIRNTVIGYQALQTNTNSSYNVAIGYHALYTQNITTNPAGGQNVAIGDRAGYDVTDGRNSVYIGAGAGVNVTNGGENVIIGSYCGTQLTTGSNCIIFGQGAQASANNVSNEVTIGDSNINKFRIPGINFILKDNGGTPTEGHVLTVDGSGEASFVGIAVTEAPVVDYTITGDGSHYYFHGGGVDETAGDPDLYLIRGQKYRFNNTTGSGHPFRFTSTGNANAAYSNGVTGSENGIQFWTIPYDAPAKLFYVCTIHSGMVGNIYIRGAGGHNTNVGLTTFSSDVILDSGDMTVSHTGLAVNIFESTDNHSRFRIKSGSSSLAQLEFADQDDADAGEIRYDHGNDRMIFHVGNNTERLRIASDSNITQTIDTDGDGFIITAGDMKPMLTGNSNRSAHNNTIFGISGKWNNTEVGRIAFEAGPDTTNKDDGKINLYTRVSGGSLTSRLLIDSNGDINLGNNPTNQYGYRLNIEDSSQILYAQTASSGGTELKLFLDHGNTIANFGTVTSTHLALVTGNTERLRITATGNVGVNQSNPDAYHSSGQNLVVGSGSGDEGMTIVSGTSSNGVINFADGTAGSQSYMGRILYRHDDNAMTFHTNTGSERLRITSSGRVLIGTSSAFATAQAYRLFQIGQADGGWINLARTGVPSNGNHLGAIQGFTKSADGNYHDTTAIDFKADGTISNSSKPSRIEFYTTAGSSTSKTERLRIAADGTITTLGTTARSDWITTSLKPSFQIASNYNPWLSLFKHSADPYGPYLCLGKTRGTSATSNTVVQDGDELGNIMFEGTDGSTFRPGARIVAKVDGTPGSGDMPTRLSFLTTSDGQNNVTERLRIQSNGRVLINPNNNILPGNAPGGGGGSNTNGYLNVRSANGEMALGLLNSNSIANNAARGTVLTGINFINRNYYTSSNKAGTGYVIRNEKGHGAYMDRCDLRLIPGYDGNTLYSNRSVVFEFDGAVRPGSDDYASLGTSGARWTAVYATNGSIQTSDENLKQNIQSLSSAEMNAAARISKLFITYKWKSKVAKEEAGGDAARIHTGVIAQRIKAALEAEGLTAADYSFWCENITWKDSEGNIVGDGRKTGVGVYDELTDTTPSTDGFIKTVEYAVRYDELLSFVSAYNEQRFTSLEARVAALESS